MLAWSANWLAHYANDDARGHVRDALVALAERGDEPTKEHVAELLDPELARARFRAMGTEMLKTVEDFMQAGGAEGLLTANDAVELGDLQAVVMRQLDELDRLDRQ